MCMKIIKYEQKYQPQIISLILHIQNEEAKINLHIEDQPDLLDIPKYYENNGGEFWIAIENDEVIGTIALMNYGNGNGVLKKFFVRVDRRSQKVGLALYQVFMQKVKEDGYRRILLDTPSVAEASHRFYEKSGFVRISKSDLPFRYEYADRNSLLYLLEIH